MAVAIDAICIRQGRVGVSFTDNGLSITMRSRQPQPLQNTTALLSADGSIDVA